MTATIPDSHQHRPIEVLRQPEDDSQPARRDLSPDDWTRFEGYASEILGAFGMDLSNPGTKARRVDSSRLCSTPPTATTGTPSC